MTIGFSVEGSTDEALLTGLQRRWCPAATLVKGKVRGTSGISSRREIRKVCIELRTKNADLVVFLRDANLESWRTVLKEDEAHCDGAHRHFAIFGVCDRNVECWLAADPDYIANRFHRDRRDFLVSNPKRAVESTFGITRHDKKEEQIASFVKEAPLKNWLNSPSFEDFYGKLWNLSKRLPLCKIENLRDTHP